MVASVTSAGYYQCYYINIYYATPFTMFQRLHDYVKKNYSNQQYVGSRYVLTKASSDLMKMLNTNTQQNSWYGTIVAFLCTET